jgi:hypothetical protein
MFAPVAIHSPASDSGPALWDRYPARSTRVLLLLGAIWVLSLFDYAYTVEGVGSGLADECNPLVLWLTGTGPHGLLAYKLLLVGFATIGFLMTRHSPLAEPALIVMVVVLAVVVLRWEFVYDTYALAEIHAPRGYPVYFFD